jgi:cysteine-rich repeat protein
MLVLSCVALVMACSGDTQTSAAAAESTEIDLLITDPATAPEEVGALVDFVSYRITCPSSTLTPYDDSVDIIGNFEANVGDEPAVWSLVMDLPVAQCVIALWVFHEDEVVCQGSESIFIVDDPPDSNKVDIVLECYLSVTPPSADVDIDGEFEFINGNYCPRLNWLGAVPPVVEAAVPAVTTIETSSFDPDGTCGQNCDPQTCDFTQNPPICTPAPDPGYSTTLYAPAGYGSFDTPTATGNPIDHDTTFTCDPAVPGPTEICVLATDGDNDCEQIRCITIECPDLCAAVDCDDGNDCTSDSCDPLTGVCSNVVAPDGIACDNCNSTCQLGVCDPGAPFIADIEGTSMNFSGNLQNYSATLVNPYSGASVFLNSVFNVNNATYKGTGSPSWILGTIFSDFLLVNEPLGTQRVCNVFGISADNGFDALVLADEFIVLGTMRLLGGNTADLIWANSGDDQIFGNNGNDIIDGGPGDDIIDGGFGDDTIALWPGSGFDSITGGPGVADTVEVDAMQSQILITPAANPSYEFDIFYLGNPMAEMTEVELLDLSDASIDLTTCTGAPTDVCNLCGNDMLNGGEECDDGNNVDGDGCASDCTAEY